MRLQTGIIIFVLSVCFSASAGEAAKEEPKAIASEWSAPSEEGLQTRLVSITKVFRPGKPVFIQMEVWHKDKKHWAQNALDLRYEADVIFKGGNDKILNPRWTTPLDFNTIVRAAEGDVISIISIPAKAVTPGKYSLLVEPKVTEEMILKGAVKLPDAGPLKFEIPETEKADNKQELKPDYDQAEEKLYCHMNGRTINNGPITVKQ